MIGNSVAEYIFIRVCVAALRLVLPISIFYLVACIYYRAFLVSSLLGFLTLSEAIFYFLVFLPRKRLLQRPTTYKSPALTSSQRKALFMRCCADLKTLVRADWPPYPRGWFLPSKTSLQDNIRRQEVANWLLCILFSSTPEEMKEAWKEELEAYITTTEHLLGETFSPETGGSGLKSMRVTFDEVKMAHRPLIWYSIVCLVDMITCFRLFFSGFQHYSSTHAWFETFPPRPALSFISKKAHSVPDIQLPYWYRPHKSSTKLPVMFLHGIGIGLHPYLPFIHDIVSLEPDVGILLVELLPITMHMTTHPVPPASLIASALNAILDSHAISRIVLSAHSYSTFISSCILHDAYPAYGVPLPNNPPPVPHPLLSKLAHIVLVDPIPVLLHLPSVAYNFLYRSPSTAAEWQLWYFASMDPDIARSLSRTFFWTEGVTWKEDIRRWMRVRDNPTETRDGGGLKKDRNVAIILGGSDQIIPAETIRRHLTEEPEMSARWVGAGWAYWDQARSSRIATSVGVSRWPLAKLNCGDPVGTACEEGPKNAGGGNLEVLFNPELDHATVFDARKREPLLDVFIRFINDW